MWTIWLDGFHQTAHLQHPAKAVSRQPSGRQQRNEGILTTTHRAIAIICIVTVVCDTRAPKSARNGVNFKGKGCGGTCLRRTWPEKGKTEAVTCNDGQSKHSYLHNGSQMR